MKHVSTFTAARLSRFAFGLIVAIMPFYAFLAVWLSSGIGHYTAIRLIKEVFIFVAAALFAGLAFSEVARRRRLLGDRTLRYLIYMIALFVLLALLGGLKAYVSGTVSAKALGYGLIADLRPLAMFTLGLCAAALCRTKPKNIASWRLILLPAVLVVGFALLQLTLLPHDFLRHFGYGTQTIPAFSTVDQKAGYVRLQSTMRGSNPLGAYLVLILPLAAVCLRLRRKRFLLTAFILAAATVLFFTYSRSAWLGAATAFGVLVWIMLPSPRAKKRLLIGLVCLAVVSASMLAALRHNDVVQNIVFHTDEHSLSPVSSNSGHAGALKNGLADLASDPLGRGTGTAGPASAYNTQPARIAENYYVQIGQELGWAGLMALVAIHFLTAARLWSLRRQPLALGLLAAFAGISVVNMMSHGWTDETISSLWWGLAGAVFSRSEGGHAFKTD